MLVMPMVGRLSCGESDAGLLGDPVALAFFGTAGCQSADSAGGQDALRWLFSSRPPSTGPPGQALVTVWGHDRMTERLGEGEGAAS